MKIIHFFTLISFFSISFTALGQTSRTQKTTDEESLTRQDKNHFPIYYENVFGYNKDIFYSFNWFLDGDGPDGFIHFVNAGITNNFAISAGAVATDVINIGEPEQFYISPEFNFPLQEKLYLAVHLKTVIAGEAVLFKPATFIGFGTSGKQLAIGYSPSINDEGDFNALGFGEFAYTGGAIKVHGRYPLFIESNYKLSVFGKADYGTVDFSFGFGSFETKLNSLVSGLEFQFKRFNIIAAYQRYAASFDGDTDSDGFFSLGASVSILGK